VIGRGEDKVGAFVVIVFFLEFRRRIHNLYSLLTGACAGGNPRAVGKIEA
jgi:hypothetical protein